MSFLSRHRTICAVLQQMRQLAEQRSDHLTIQLCDEAREYAESMSAALVKYKAQITPPK